MRGRFHFISSDRLCFFLRYSGQKSETSMKNCNTINTEQTDSDFISWSIVYAGLGIKVIVLNALALCIFIKTRSLRTRKHVMVINFVVADLLFGAFFPFLLVYILKTPLYLTLRAIFWLLFRNQALLLLLLSLPWNECTQLSGQYTTPRYGQSLQNSPCRYLDFIGCLNNNSGDRRTFISLPFNVNGDHMSDLHDSCL